MTFICVWSSQVPHEKKFDPYRNIHYVLQGISLLINLYTYSEVTSFALRCFNQVDSLNKVRVFATYISKR